MRFLVMGGSGDLGQRIIYDLITQGHKVCATYNTKAHSDLFTHDNLLWEKIDLSQDADNRDFIENLGEFDGFIHAAGVVYASKIENSEPKQVREMLSVNLESAILATSVLYPKMITNGFGRLVFLGSIVGKNGGIGLTAYSSTKSGLEGFVRSLHREILLERRKNQDLDLTVNLVRPGYVKSKMTNDLKPKIVDSIVSNSTLGRFVTPQEVSRFILLLLESNSSSLSGAFFDIDGGQSI